MIGLGQEWVDPLDEHPQTDFEAGEQERLAAAWESVLASPAGRLVIGDLLARCHVYAASLAPDALAMAALEGERAVGLWVLGARIQRLAPASYETILRERRDVDEMAAAEAARNSSED